LAKRKTQRDLDEQPGGLQHNPFAALRGSVDPTEPANTDAPSETAPTPANPEATPERLVVRKERTGRGGKTITRVSGWSSGDHDLEARARDLKRALGCGASVEGDDVCVQGDQVERVAAHLERSQRARVVRGN
jgi:translation initiation factor 1